MEALAITIGVPSLIFIALPGKSNGIAGGDLQAVCVLAAQKVQEVYGELQDGSVTIQDLKIIDRFSTRMEGLLAAIKPSSFLQKQFSEYMPVLNGRLLDLRNLETHKHDIEVYYDLVKDGKQLEGIYIRIDLHNIIHI